MPTLRRCRRRRLFPTLLIALALVMIAACGDKDEGTPVPRQGQALLPAARIDSVPPAPADAGETTVPEPGASAAATTPKPTAETIKAAAPSPERAARKPISGATQAGTKAWGAYSLQLGSFRQEANAKRQAARLRERGHAVQIEVAVLGGQTYHRVFLHGIADRDTARRLGEKIHRELDLAYLIRRN